MSLLRRRSEGCTRICDHRSTTLPNSGYKVKSNNLSNSSIWLSDCVWLDSLLSVPYNIYMYVYKHRTDIKVLKSNSTDINRHMSSLQNQMPTKKDLNMIIDSCRQCSLFVFSIHEPIFTFMSKMVQRSPDEHMEIFHRTFLHRVWKY